MQPKIRKAKIQDAKAIHDLIKGYSKKGLMLYRPVSEITMHIRDYFVAEIAKKVIGCIALRIWTQTTAEIYALAVSENFQRQGIGSSLIKNCIEEAKELGIKKIITLTYREILFGRFGFKKTRAVPTIMYTERTIDIDKAFSLSL